MAVRQILVDWSTVNGGGKVSVFNFNAETVVASQRAALNTFLGAVDAICHNTATWTIRTSGNAYNEATGELQADWVDSTPFSGTGAISAGSPEADAVQALVRWGTGSVVAGRFLKGRTFIPGVAQGAIVSGNLGPTSVAALAAAGNALIGANVGLSVWRRPHTASAGDPRPSYSGVLEAAVICTAWPEMAVLRRRRG